jgi:hypothetical protein
VSGAVDDGVYPNFATVGSNVGASYPVRTCGRPVAPRSASCSVRRTERAQRLNSRGTTQPISGYARGHGSLRLLTVQVQNVCDARRATPTRRLVGSAEGRATSHSRLWKKTSLPSFCAFDEHSEGMGGGVVGRIPRNAAKQLLQGSLSLSLMLGSGREEEGHRTAV